MQLKIWRGLNDFEPPGAVSTGLRGSCQRFNLACENMERFKYVQDGLACSKNKKINDILVVEKSNVFFFESFERMPEGPVHLLRPL